MMRGHRIHNAEMAGVGQGELSTLFTNQTKASELLGVPVEDVGFPVVAQKQVPASGAMALSQDQSANGGHAGEYFGIAVGAAFVVLIGGLWWYRKAKGRKGFLLSVENEANQRLAIQHTTESSRNHTQHPPLVRPVFQAGV